MPAAGLFSKSRLSKVTANDDIENVILTKKKSSKFDLIPDELIVNMACYCQAKELVRFSETNSRYLKLLFNQDLSEFKKPKEIKSKVQTHYGSNVKKRELEAEEKKYKKDEETIDFEQVQIQIWKSLVCFYFPRFERALNIKNWMHVLRRRVAHVKINGHNFLPIINRKDDDSIYNVKSDDYFIENCEFIYKCPLKFNSLDGYGDEKNCSVCKKTVYNVEDIGSFKEHVAKGLCVSLGMSEFEEMGEMAEFE